MALTKNDDLFGCSLRGVANRVSYQLGDLTAEGESKGRHDPRYLCAVVADAIRVLAELKKEDFVEQITFDIESGSCVQTLPDECASFLDFLCFRNKGTGEEYPVYSGDFQNIRKLNYVPGPTFNRCDELGSLTSFSAGFSPNSSRIYSISPQLPDGASFEASAMCSVVGEITNNLDQDLPEVVKPLIPALVSMTAYIMLLGDTADPTAQLQAQAHLNSVTTILQITSARVAAAQAAANDN